MNQRETYALVRAEHFDESIHGHMRLPTHSCLATSSPIAQNQQHHHSHSSKFRYDQRCLPDPESGGYVELVRIYGCSTNR
jgi:hypothetical protein